MTLHAPTAGAQMGTLVSTLEFGVSSLDLEVVQGSLEALASLARQHFLAVSQGRPGIATSQGRSRNIPRCMKATIHPHLCLLAMSTAQEHMSIRRMHAHMNAHIQLSQHVW